MIRTWHGGIVSIFLLYHQAEQSHCPLQVSIWDGPVVTAILPITWGTELRVAMKLEISCQHGSKKRK